MTPAMSVVLPAPLHPAMPIKRMSLGFPSDAMDREAGRDIGTFVDVARFPRQIGQIDRRHGIRAGNQQQFAGREPGQHLAGFQHGEGALQSAKIKRMVGHYAGDRLNDGLPQCEIALPRRTNGGKPRA
jgi:hypothetical protein